MGCYTIGNLHSMCVMGTQNCHIMAKTAAMYTVYMHMTSVLCREVAQDNYI